MDEALDPTHWLYRYGNTEHYRWRTLSNGNGRTTYYRPLGLVESSFDADGRFFEGRADMNIQLDLEVQSSLSDEDFRERILFAWAALRCRHLLLQARAVSQHALGVVAEEEDDGTREFCFAMDAPKTIGQAIEDAGRQVVFLEDHFRHVDSKDFWMHCQNAARVVDCEQALGKMFVLPLERLGTGRLMLRLLIVCSHQICDGMAMSTWLRSLVHLVNMPLDELRSQLTESMHEPGILQRLPQAQEALYPPIVGSRARQRWFWLLSRILRHVRKPLPAAFPNPLRRDHPREHAVPLSPVYAPVLDYRRSATLNTFPCSAQTSPRATKRLHRICREAGTSIGAGCFALAAAIHMEFDERRRPDVPLAARQPFATGFPLNPRAFLHHYHVDPDSLMLAFSDGILLPFLPSRIPVAARLRLLARHAHRQLATFQKRAGTRLDTAGFAYMSARGAGRLIPVHYLSTMERWRARSPVAAAAAPDPDTLDPQAAYPMRPNATGQTCGVSSVGGKVAVLRRGMYDFGTGGGGGRGDFVADFRASRASVRPREGEFLVGVGGDDESTIGMNASVDANAIDPALAAEFCRRFESILEGDEDVATSKL